MKKKKSKTEEIKNNVIANGNSNDNDNKNDDNKNNNNNNNDNENTVLNESVVSKLEKEYIENENSPGVKDFQNKHCKIIYGINKGHLWYFEDELWRQVIQHILFYQKKMNCHI